MTHGLAELVEAIVNHAVLTAGKRGTKADVILGILAALRQIRAIADGSGGTALAASVDERIRSAVIVHNLRRIAVEGAAPRPVPLPDPTSTASPATAILRDAVDTSIAFEGLTQNSSTLLMATEALLDRLITLLGGAPDGEALLERIGGGSERASDPHVPTGTGQGASVH